MAINSYELFKYPDYTLPLSVKMAEVSRDHGLDVLHVHYAVPHATAAILARSMLPAGQRPRVVTTLHGTDTTLLGRDAGYGPAITYALERSDAVTTVSAYLEQETRQLLAVSRPIDVIHNFFEPHPPQARARGGAARAGSRGGGAAASLVQPPAIQADRPAARVLRAHPAARLLQAPGPRRGRRSRRSWARSAGLGLVDRVIVRENVSEIEDYLQAADIGLFTSDMESFCLSILEAMCFACPSVAAAVGGIPEVVVSGDSGLLVPPGDADGFARAVESLIRDGGRRAELGSAAKRRARELFSAEAIVTRYEQLYRRVCAPGGARGVGV